MTRITVRRALLGAAATITLLVAAGCGTGDLNHDGMNTGDQNQAGDAAAHNDADVMFVQMMIPHHQQAVEMTTLAETRAQDPELKRLVAAIKDAQQPEVATMTRWLTAWGAPTLSATEPGGMSGMGHGGSGAMAGMMSAEEMAELAASTGVAFDRLFARMMISHHNGAIQMARAHETAGTNADVRALAKAIVQSQAAEVETLQKISHRL